MALRDYRVCDVCGNKTFYDANLNYDDEGNLEHLGDWSVLCNECAKTHQTMIVLKAGAQEEAE